MAPPRPSTKNITRISLLYRIWFLYAEPIMAVAGTYLCIYQPERMLIGTVPTPALNPTSLTITPLTQMLLTNIGALYALFAINEGIVLRLTKEKNVWLAVIGAMLVSDIGHLYAVYAIAPERMWELANWSSDERINYGTLWGGALLRACFLVGIGRN